jgi:hypothetical protein
VDLSGASCTETSCGWRPARPCLLSWSGSTGSSSTAPHELESGLADQDLVGIGGVLQAGGATASPVSRPSVPATTSPVDADPALHVQLQCARASPPPPGNLAGVVLVHLRHPEHRHHRVADEPTSRRDSTIAFIRSK